jgi:hypothetical protein
VNEHVNRFSLINAGSHAVGITSKPPNTTQVITKAMSVFENSPCRYRFAVLLQVSQKGSMTLSVSSVPAKNRYRVCLSFTSSELVPDGEPQLQHISVGVKI